MRDTVYFTLPIQRQEVTLPTLIQGKQVTYCLTLYTLYAALSKDNSFASTS